MPSLDIATGDILAFWEWLKKAQPDDHKLFELWVALEEDANYNSRMGRKELLFTPVWVKEVQLRAKSKGKLARFGPLSKSNEEAIEEEGARVTGVRVTDGIRSELVRILEEVLVPHRDAWMRARPNGRGGPSVEDEEEIAAARALAARNLVPARRHQKGVLASGTEGTFWHISAAPDGEPYTVLTNRAGARPPPGLIALGRAPGAGSGPKPKTAEGTWSWFEGELWVTLREGDASLLPGIGKSLGVKAVAGKPKEGRGVVTLEQQRLLARLLALSAAEAAAPKGWFWFLRGTRRDEILLRKARTTDLDDYFEQVDHARGYWLRDDDAGVVDLRLEGERAGDRQMAERLAKAVRTRKLFKKRLMGVLSVTVTGRGFTIVDPQRAQVEAGEGPDPEYARRLTAVQAANRRLALEVEGSFWFAQFGRDGQPVLALYLDRTPLSNKRDLLTEDTSKAALAVGGTWKRDPAKRTVTLKLLGAGAGQMKRVLERYFSAANPFKERVVLG